MALRWCVAAALVLAAGCAELDPRGMRVLDTDALLAEVVQTARAPAPEQKAALTRAQQAFLKDASPLNRLRLAALLSLLPDPLHDDARAAELLDPIADAGVPGVGRVAALLRAQVTERRRLVRELERTAGERAAADKERDKREEALRQQVEALRDIERGIREREERLRRRPN
jgi:hypothetical protein